MRPDIRYIVMHSPGPNWRTGVDFREQPGIAFHRDHYAAALARGQLEMGGPYLTPDTGGMMVPAAGLSEDEIRTLASSDPAVQNGLLTFEIRPWYVAMKR